LILIIGLAIKILRRTKLPQIRQRLLTVCGHESDRKEIMDITLADVFYWVGSALATVAVFGGLYAVIVETTDPVLRPATLPGLVPLLLGVGGMLWLVGCALRYFLASY
jgi:hypothetical protein